MLDCAFTEVLMTIKIILNIKVYTSKELFILISTEINYHSRLVLFISVYIKGNLFPRF